MKRPKAEAIRLAPPWGLLVHLGRPQGCTVLVSSQFWMLNKQMVRELPLRFCPTPQDRAPPQGTMWGWRPLDFGRSRGGLGWLTPSSISSSDSSSVSQSLRRMAGLLTCPCALGGAGVVWVTAPSSIASSDSSSDSQSLRRKVAGLLTCPCALGGAGVGWVTDPSSISSWDSTSDSQSLWRKVAGLLTCPCALGGAGVGFTAPSSISSWDSSLDFQSLRRKVDGLLTCPRHFEGLRRLFSARVDLGLRSLPPFIFFHLRLSGVDSGTRCRSRCN